MLSSALCFVVFLFMFLGGGVGDVLVGALSASGGPHVLVVLIGVRLGQIPLDLVGLGLGFHGCSLLPDLPEPEYIYTTRGKQQNSTRYSGI